MSHAKSIIWSPHAGYNQFLVSGTELKLYEWIQGPDDGTSKAHFITNIPNNTLVTCADWSPDPTRQDLIAIGLTTGKTVLVRMQDHVSSESPYPGSEGAQTSPLYRSTSSFAPMSPKQYPVLGVKMSRPCNTVSFSRTHPHLLAAGLDKVRNDPCLLVWDISQAVDSYCNTPTGSQTPTTPYQSRFSDGRPASTSHTRNDSDLRKDTQESFYSDRLRFTPSQLNVDHAVPLQASSSREQRPLLQYGSSEAITSCTWSVHGQSPLLIAGMGNKYLRVYDIRDHGSSPLQYSTKAVYGIVVDPFNSFRMAAYTEDGVVKLLDIRNPNDAVLTLNNDAGTKHTVSRIEFSPTRSGVLASLTRDALRLNIWDIQEMTPAPLSFATRSSQERASTYSGLEALSNVNEQEIDVPVLWRSRKSSQASKTVTTFSFVPNTINREGSSSHALIPKVLTMHKDGSFELLSVNEASKMSWRPSGELAIASEGSIISYGLDNIQEIIKTTTSRINALDIANDNGVADKLKISIAQKPSADRYTPTEADEFIRKELASDISVVMRKRATKGYSMECAKNKEIVHQDRKLHEVWTWVETADRLSTTGEARIGNIDYGFQGLYGLWANMASPSATPKIGNQLSNGRGPNIRPGQGKGSSNEESQEEDYVALHGVQSSRMTERRLALKMYGFSFTATEFEEELVKLEMANEYDKAAGWAFFNGMPNRAIQALGSKRGEKEDDQERKLMSAVLAGFQPDDSRVNAMWRDICESLSQDMVDRPYMRAILSFIASNDWFRILNEKSLSLRERMVVALRVLDDEQLSVYLNHVTDKLIQDGDVEGIVVTGLTSRGIDLLEQMVNRYGDVQTAGLISSFVVPRRFKDKRVDDWIYNYRQLLDRWQMWHGRAKFDIERGQRMNNASDIAPPQVFVRCIYCSQSLGHSLVVQNVRSRDGKRVNVQANASSAAGARNSAKLKPTICPSCRKPLPRCALCLLHMGTPIDPMRRAIVANDPHHTDPAGFDMWFTWCQSCRHGGHAIHMHHWFQKHSTCPVSNCSCQCQM